MKVIIWGLPYDMQAHMIRESTAYILFFVIVCLVIARFVSCQDYSQDYFSVIRSKGYRYLWRKWWLKIIIFSFILVSFMFFVFKILDLILQWNIMRKGWLMPYFLWFLGVCLIGMIFMLFHNYRYGQVISFLAIVCGEVFCIYMSEKLMPISAMLIGNYVMLERSNYIVENGYPVKVIISILCLFIGCCGFTGNYIAFRRGRV